MRERQRGREKKQEREKKREKQIKRKEQREIHRQRNKEAIKREGTLLQIHLRVQQLARERGKGLTDVHRSCITSKSEIGTSARCKAGTSVAALVLPYCKIGKTV